MQRLLESRRAAVASVHRLCAQRSVIAAPCPRVLSTKPRISSAWAVTEKTRLGNRNRSWLPPLRFHSTCHSHPDLQPISSTMASSGDGSEWHRLPKHVVPTHYDITLKSDLENLTFTGVTTVSLDVIEETDAIVFNAAAKLLLSKAVVTSEALKTDNKSVVALAIDTKHERATASLPNKLPKGSKAQLTVSFAGTIDNSMAGYYRSTYEHDGKKGFYALTQFEPTSARRAIPTWDEPSLKATFAFRMIHRKETVSLSNMNEVSSNDVTSVEAEQLLRTSELGLDLSQLKLEDVVSGKTQNTTVSNDWKLTEFATTPKVSTYLVAWANGPFVSLEDSYTSPLTGRVVPMRIYTTPEYIHQAQYALDVKVKILPVYEKVFDVAYPLPKLDTLVASDFDAGAMENWGLITGRTVIYLYDPVKSGLKSQKLTASVQSHEVAHQWFGNIATLAWWDNLWLNEAFATLMGEVVIIDRCFPEWGASSEFINQHLAKALDLDARRSSHPIQVPLQGENVEKAVNQVFDAISYSKGASVLRMLSDMIGEDVFLKGVSIYLKKHLYANAVAEDLWEGISESSGKDIASFMSNWILKQGFPVLTVTEEQDAIHIKQNRFLSTGDVKPEEDETLWNVPLMLKTVGTDGKPTIDRDAFLDGKRETRIALKDAKNATFKLNAGTIGVYRVAYTAERLAKIGEEAQKKDSAFSLEDRVGLVGDAFTLAKAGYGKTSGALTLAKALKDDSSFLVNGALKVHLDALDSVWWEQDESVQAAINKLRADVFGPKAKQLGFEGSDSDTPEIQEVRNVVITAAAAGGDEWTVSEIKRRFAPLVENGDDSLIPANVLPAIYSTSASLGGEKEYEALLKVFRNPATPFHKASAMSALCNTQSPELIQRTFELLFSPEVKEQDYIYFYASLGRNPHSRRSLWKNTQDRYEYIWKRFDGNYTSAGLMSASFNQLTTKKDAQEVEAYFATKDVSKFSMKLDQGLDAVRANAKWVETDAADVKVWLSENGYL